MFEDTKRYQVVHWRETYPAAEGDFSRIRFRGVVATQTPPPTVLRAMSSAFELARIREPERDVARSPLVQGCGQYGC
jgi:hypothetical protein